MATIKINDIRTGTLTWTPRQSSLTYPDFYINGDWVGDGEQHVEPSNKNTLHAVWALNELWSIVLKSQSRKATTAFVNWFNSLDRSQRDAVLKRSLDRFIRLCA